MGEMRTTWYDNGKHKSNSVSVTAKEICCYGLSDIISPSDIVGVGSCYGSALEDYINQFDEYIKKLKEFRETFLDSKRVYQEAVEVDCFGKEV